MRDETEDEPYPTRDVDLLHKRSGCVVFVSWLFDDVTVTHSTTTTCDCAVVGELA
jgi:hypothetical protein